MKRFLAITLLLILILSLSWSLLLWLRPPQTDQRLDLFQGVYYERDARSLPRPLMVHVVTVDLTAPGIRLLVTPGQETAGMELPARTATQFLAEFDLQLAINGSFFKPFHSRGLWDYYPYSGDPVKVTGLAIANRVTYSAAEAGHPVLCISAGHRARIDQAGCAPDTVQALAGTPLLVEQARPVMFDRSYFLTRIDS